MVSYSYNQYKPLPVMSERTVIELLALKLSGEATAADLVELEKLIEKNPDSIYHQEIFQQVFSNKADNEDLDAYYHRHRLKYKEGLVFAGEKIPVFNYFKKTSYLLVACSLILLLGIAGFFIYNTNQPVSIYNTEISSGNVVRKNILLPDGTKISLNAHSKILYDKDMNHHSERAVKLIGEAFFDVSHNPKRPFVITTNKISIKVLGTAFNVKAYPRERETEATLLRGSIELSVNHSNAKKTILKPFEKFALIDQSSGKMIMKVVPIMPVKVAGKEYTQEVAWIENKLVFANETFEQLKPKLEKRFNIHLEIKNEYLNAYHFTGAFTEENLEETLTAMQLIKHFNFKIKGNDVKIY